MRKLQQLAGTISGIYCEELILAEPFESLAARFADQQGTVVLLSGEANSKVREQACAKGAVAALQKPVDGSQLQEMIGSLPQR